MDPRAEIRTYEATQIARVGEARFQLIAPPHRKRLNTIVVEVSDDVLLQLAEARGVVTPAAEIAALREESVRRGERLRNLQRIHSTALEERDATITRQAQTIADYETRLAELDDLLQLRNRENAELTVELKSLKEDLHALRDRFNVESVKSAARLKRIGAFKAAIYAALNPTDPRRNLRVLHTKLRSALASRGFHPRIEHPVWSFDYWFGCSRCVPAWMLCAESDLPEEKAEVMQAAADALMASHSPALSIAPGEGEE